MDWFGSRSVLEIWYRDEQKARGLDSRARKIEGRPRLSHVGGVKEKAAEATADRRVLRRRHRERRRWDFEIFREKIKVIV